MVTHESLTAAGSTRDGIFASHSHGGPHRAAPPNPQRPTTIVEVDAFRGERFGGQRGQQDRAGTALAQQRVGDLASSNQAEIASARFS